MTASPAFPLTFEPEGHVYKWRGSVVPSVTQILRDMKISPAYPPDRGLIAFGVAVHKCCDLILRDRLELGDSRDPYPGTSNILWPYLNAFRDAVSTYQIEAINTELPVYSQRHGFAGQLDLHCWIFGRKDEAIIDFKTGQPPESTALQTAAYDLALSESVASRSGRTQTRRRFAMRLLTDETKTAGKTKLTEFTDPMDATYFTGILNHWKYLNRKGVRV